jgi:tyrosine-protein kinase Etk/Wzc
VSIGIVQALVTGVNEFNQNSRQSQASAERKFVEGRMAIANAELRAAEDRMEGFLRSNRQYVNSPDLTLQRERLQREVIQRQQVYSQLAQSYEEVRLREVRDTPVITIIEPPSAPALPEPRGRSKVVFLGIMLGGFVGVMLVLFADMRERRRQAGVSDADDLVAALHAARGDLARPFRWAAGRTRR